MTETSENSEPFDLESEWPEARAWFRGPSGADDGDREALWLYPVALLYAGFFFGPFVTVLVAVFAMKGRITLRHAAILTGVAGTVWCLLQGLSAWSASTWTEYHLQAMRSTLNFVNGVVAYITVRQTVMKTMKPTTRTLQITLFFILLAVALFFLTPGKLLVALGR